MNSGLVIEGHAVIKISFRTPNRPDFPIDFVVDTGFTGDLCLPLEAVAALGLSFDKLEPARLANDSQIELSVYRATILWDGAEREVGVLATGRRPLVGTAMLENHELVIQFTEGGIVTIDEL